MQIFFKSIIKYFMIISKAYNRKQLGLLLEKLEGFFKLYLTAKKHLHVLFSNFNSFLYFHTQHFIL